MREFAEDKNPDKKWIMFDGPVDAIWIENMNTVLDDNKKLCLVSGEIIQMSSTMTMMFEVEDLAVASPATVSRCGMVYMEPSALGYTPLLTSWVDRLHSVLKPFQSQFSEMFEALVPPLIAYTRKNLREVVSTTNHNLANSFFRLLDSMLLTYVKAEEFEGLDEEKKQKLASSIDKIVIFSILWSIGGSCSGHTTLFFNIGINKVIL